MLVAPAPAAFISLSSANKSKNSTASVPTQELEAPVSKMKFPSIPLILAESSK